jgi:ABC-type glucose/galactose transport system permease subunit
MRTASTTSASLIEHRNLYCLPAGEIDWLISTPHISGSLLGVLAVSVAFKAAALLGLSTYYKYLFPGALLILAVGVGTLARRRAAR